MNPTHQEIDPWREWNRGLEMTMSVCTLEDVCDTLALCNIFEEVSNSLLSLVFSVNQILFLLVSLCGGLTLLLLEQL